MNTSVLEGVVLDGCTYTTEQGDFGEREVTCHMVIESLVQVEPRIYCQVELRSTDLDVMCEMEKLQPGDYVIARSSMVTKYTFEKGKIEPNDYYGMCSLVKHIERKSDNNEANFNAFICDGKATGDCQCIPAKKNGERVELCKVTVVTQVQDRPDLDCQVQLQSYDPAVTMYMKGIRKGDHVVAQGKYAMKFKDEKNRTTPVFRFVICDYIKKWNQ